MRVESSAKKKLMFPESVVATQPHRDEEEKRLKEECTTVASAGMMLSKLPREIIHEILLKLPTETLSICRAVNKAWYHTIKNCSFIKTYNTRVIRDNNFSFVIHQDHAPLDFHDQDDADETSLSFYSQTPPIAHIQSCNGFLLAISKPKDPYFLFNPLTGKHMVVHAPKRPGHSFNLAIDGFGWDSASQVFKIVRISDDCTHKLYFGTYLQVYNFGTGQWTTREDQVPFRVSWVRRFAYVPNTLLQGLLHWMAYSYAYDGTISIVSFKLDTEEFQEVPLPPGLDLDPVESRPPRRFLGVGIPSDRRRFPHHLLVLGGCLSLVHTMDEHIDIWVMEEYGSASSWGKKHIIRNINLMNQVRINNWRCEPIHLMLSGEILLLCSDQYLGYYHPVTKHFRAFDAGDILYRQSVTEPSLHIGSLVYVADKPCP